MAKYRVYVHAPDTLHPSDPGVDTSVTTNAEDEEEAKHQAKAFYGNSITIKKVEEV